MNTQQQKRKKWSIVIVVVLVILGFGVFKVYSAATAPNTQCTTAHEQSTTSSKSPLTLQTAMDYFAQGDYEYDRGNCKRAIADYSQAITLNPTYAEAYNNRAYTYMMEENYAPALPDLDTAIQIRPNYINALMNRGDIYNYYYHIDRKRAINDYERVIALGGAHGTSVCGHLLLAKHNGWNVGTFLDLPRGIANSCH